MITRTPPVVEFEATLITRGGGTGAKRLMEQNPERGDYIRSVTGWRHVEPGTLTLDRAHPLPVPALVDVVPLAVEPEDLLQHLEPRDAHIANLRGAPTYYGGVARARNHERKVILSQQPRPAVEHRLEIIADVRLRDTLSVANGDKVTLAVYNAPDWRELRVAPED